MIIAGAGHAYPCQEISVPKRFPTLVELDQGRIEPVEWLVAFETSPGRPVGCIE